MAAIDGFPINFTMSTAARNEVDHIRADWNSKFHDPADVFMVAWGEFIPNAGQKFENVIVSFYGKSDRPDIEKCIEILNGLEIFFYVNKFTHGHFRGKVLDHTPDAGFFLR